MKLSDYVKYYIRKLSDYRIFTYAASASFFIITALLPLIMLTLSIISFTPLAAQDFLDMVANILPESFRSMFYYLADDMIDTGFTALSVSVVVLLWSASKSVLGLMDGLNAIAKVDDYRNYFLKRAVCIVYMLFFIIGLIITLGLQVFSRVFSQMLLVKLKGKSQRLASILSVIMNFHQPVIFLVTTLILVLIYTFFPNKKMRLLMQIPGAVFASFTWLLFSDIYSFYVENFSSYSMVYGSIGVAILAMIWLYFCISFVFIGAVFNQLYPSIFWRMVVGLRYRFMLRREESGRLVRRYSRKYRKLKKTSEAARMQKIAPGQAAAAEAADRKRRRRKSR